MLLWSCSACIANNMVIAHAEPQAPSLSHREYNSRSAKTEEVVIAMSCRLRDGLLQSWKPKVRMMKTGGCLRR